MALRDLGPWIWAIFLFGFAVNLLTLTGPLYMLQVYDRVLGSRSEATLLVLTLLMTGLFWAMGVFDHVRARIAARVGAAFQSRLEERVFRITLDRALAASERGRSASAPKELEAIRSFISSPVFLAIFDLPWVPAFVALIYVFHPWLAGLAVAGGLVLAALTGLNQIRTKYCELDANRSTLASDAFAEAMRQNAETVRALGSDGHATQRWRDLRRKALAAQLTASDRTGVYANASKIFRYFLQSAVLGLGAYLVIHGQMTAGGIIAASVMLGRALQPIEQAIGGWPLLLRARDAWSSLRVALEASPRVAPPMALPKPRAILELNAVTVFPPETQRASLRMISLRLEPGNAVGVIGASASGKSSLARVLTGLWSPSAGSVRLDGATLDQYDPETLGRHVGYLPQDVALFDGTVAENIARLEPRPDPDAVVAAARKAGAHEMILALPQGYDTPVAAGGARLSGGQRQRIGLARALYGEPVLLVLDEPNASLDTDGSNALNFAIRGARTEGRAVVVMSHRPTGIAECNLLLVLDKGALRAFGPRDEVLRAHVKNIAQIVGGPAPAAGADHR
jgi:ATP-binding cassette, subfamily C, bacterial